jgi:hypothetical protein
MLFGAWTLGLALLAVVIGPYMIFNSYKALRGGEGMFDQSSTSRMTLINWVVIIIGAAAIIWGLRALWQLYSLAF